MATTVVRLRISRSLLEWRKSGWTKVHEEGRCRMCERTWAVRDPTRHHLVPQSWFQRRTFVVVIAEGGGQASTWFRSQIRDCDANIIPLCSPCHIEVEMTDMGKRMLRKRLGSNEVAFANAVRPHWIDVIYPPTPVVRVPLALVVQAASAA